MKTDRVSKYTLSVQKLCYSQHKYKGSSKKYYPFIILVMLQKMNQQNWNFPNTENKEKQLKKLLQTIKNN